MRKVSSTKKIGDENFFVVKIYRWKWHCNNMISILCPKTCHFSCITKQRLPDRHHKLLDACISVMLTYLVSIKHLSTYLSLRIHSIWGIYLTTTMISRPALGCSYWWEFVYTECQKESIKTLRYSNMSVWCDFSWWRIFVARLTNAMIKFYLFWSIGEKNSH